MRQGQGFLFHSYAVSMGGISTVLIINFLSVWNEFMLSLVLMRSNDAKTLPVGIMNFRAQYNVDWGPLMAGMFVAALPPIVFYFVFHKNIIKGMTAGAVKQ